VSGQDFDVEDYARRRAKRRSLAKKIVRALVSAWVVLSLASWALYQYEANRDRAKRVSVRELARDVRAGRVLEIEIGPGETHDEYRYMTREAAGARVAKVVTGEVDPELQLEIKRRDIKVRRTKTE
jgi:hypothetical protein